ncbi:hypothetical protein CROQUDRAFT_54099, partial [Cronartium quercuum f. sp. fusiforme G11]
LETIAQHDAREDFANWFDNGMPYQVIMANSWKKHTQGSAALHLRNTIVIYSRAAGYLKEIISMANREPGAMISKSATQDIEMEAMGSAPSAAHIQAVDLEDEDWIVLRKEEAQQGDYHGLQWSILQAS